RHAARARGDARALPVRRVRLGRRHVPARRARARSRDQAAAAARRHRADLPRVRAAGPAHHGVQRELPDPAAAHHRRGDRAERPLVCSDGVAGVLVTLAAAPAGWRALAAGFVLFRIFDQVKPWPARHAESLAGGAGIMADDLVAGAWGAAVLLVARRLGWL